MRNSRRKNRRARAASSSSSINNNPNKGDVVVVGGGGEESKEVRDVKCLAEAFSLVSVDDVCSAYKEAQGDLNKAADILGGLLVVNDDDPSSSSSSSSERFFGSTSSSSEGFFWSTSEDPPTSSNLSSCSSERLFESDVVQTPPASKGFGGGGSKHKRVIASTGTVSTVLGKSYASSTPMDGGGGGGGGKHYNSPSNKWKQPLDFSAGNNNNEEAERFLFSMLGDGCELSMALVRDVFSQCGYDIEKASDALLDLSASSYDQRKYSNQNGSCKRVSNILTECNDNVEDTVGRYQFPGTVSDSNFHLFEKEVQDVLRFWDHDRKYSEVLLGPKKHSSQSRPVTTEANLPQKILDSLFNVPKSSEVKPGSMNWKNVVKKIESLGERLNTQPTGGPLLQENTEYVKGEEYHVFREAAKQHWQKMRSYHQKAATAYSRGEKDYAVYLSEQAKVQNKMAREADEKASKDIFEARNKEIKNVLTIDLHGQHVKQAIRVLKIHLLFMMCTASVQLLRVITGCGSQGYGKGKLKQSVINLAEKAGVEWCEENQGTVVIKLDGRRELNFADFESDTE